MLMKPRMSCPTFLAVLALSLILTSQVSADGGLWSTWEGRVALLVPPNQLVIQGLSLISVDSTTEYVGGIGGYFDLAPGMLVRVWVQWQANGTLLAGRVEKLGDAATLTTVSGKVISVGSAPGWWFELDGGELVKITPETPLDGDVDSLSDLTLMLGATLRAECYALADNHYVALSAFVSTPFFELYFPVDDPYSHDEELFRYFTERNEALVALADGADPVAVAARHNALILGVLPGTVVYLFSWPGMDVEDHVWDLYLDDPDVADIQPNLTAWDPETIGRRVIALDRHATIEKYTRQEAVKTIGLDEAHEVTTGAGTLIAVLDTGIDPTHPLLRHCISDDGWDFVDDDATPWETADLMNQDDDADIDEAVGHGTFVAGLIHLVAPSATILVYRVLNDDGVGTTFCVCEAVIAAMDRGADVINMSFEFEIRSQILDRLLDEAARRGIVLVTGAGNSSGQELQFPALDHRVIAVAATDADGFLAQFSNSGPQVAISAPGLELYSSGADGEMGTWNGTSMAAPLVSGTVALLRAKNPRLGPEDITAALLQSALPPAGTANDPPMLHTSSALELVPSPGDKDLDRRHIIDRQRR